MEKKELALKKEIDLNELAEKLAYLRGLDLEAAEREERAAGNNQPLLEMSKSFQIRVAARALGVNVHELKDLPLKKYERITQIVFNFFFSTEDAT